MATRFETERLIIRDYEPNDAPGAFDMYRREEVHRFLLRQPAPSLEFMAERIQEYQDEWSSKPYGFWAVEERESGRFVGSCILKPLPNDERYEVGWHVHPELQGKGYATEFGLGAIRYGFAELGLDAIYAILRPDNAASKRVAEKLEMRFLELTNRYHGLELAFFGIERGEATWRATPLEHTSPQTGGPCFVDRSEMVGYAAEVLREAITRFPLAKPVELEFRPLRVTAGRAQFDRNLIILSSIVLRDRESVSATLLHEYAHLMAFEREGRAGRGHGAAWRRAMLDLGQTPQTYHRYPVRRNSRRQTVVYRCRKCLATFERHRRLPRSGKYVHARCGGALEFIGSLKCQTPSTSKLEVQ